MSGISFPMGQPLLVEDPADPGTFIITNPDLLVESTSDPGTYNGSS